MAFTLRISTGRLFSSWSEGCVVSAVLSGPVLDVVAAVDKLCADDRLITCGGTQMREVEAIVDAGIGVQAAIVQRLIDIDSQQVTTELCGRGTRRWLVEDLCLSEAEAGRLTRLARDQPARPLTRQAFGQRAISGAHAAAILTALSHLPPDLRDTVEPHLIDRARCYPPEEIAAFVDELLQALGIDKDSDIRRERRHAARGLDVATTLDGNRSVKGTLTPDVGARFKAALDAAAQPCGPDDDRSLRQRQHDALGVIADTFMAQQEPSFTGAPRTVIVTIDLATLEHRLRNAWITTPHGPLAPDTARRLACDAELIPLVLGGRSEVLDIGIADHEFTTAQRRAAYHRDGGTCAFPRCRNKCVELHHIKFRRHNGPTSLDNAAWLCAYHHWLVHEGRWTLQRDPTGDYHWTSPHGRELIRKLATA
jgi:hypothetical protein